MLLARADAILRGSHPLNGSAAGDGRHRLDGGRLGRMAGGTAQRLERQAVAAMQAGDAEPDPQRGRADPLDPAGLARLGGDDMRACRTAAAPRRLADVRCWLITAARAPGLAGGPPG